jgi:zinc protease
MRREESMRSIRKLMARMLLTGFALLVLAGPGLIWDAEVRGQDSSPDPVSRVERKNRAPVSTEVLQVKFPRPIEAKLNNGLTVLILEDHRFPAIFAQFHLRGAGALFEPEHLSGLANVTAAMLREGTRTRTSRQIAEEIEMLGASLGAGSGFGSAEAVLSASGLSDNLDAWFAVALDVLLHPVFPQDELAKLKQRLKVQLRQQRSNVRFLASERFSRAVYGDHPAGVVTPTVESVDAFTPALLAQWHRERYTPQNAILAVAGDVRADQLLPKLERWLAGWEKSDEKEALPPDPMPASARKVYLVDRPGSVQTTVVLGNIAIDRGSPDYFPMVVMNHLLGGGPAARLFLNLREEKGYSYGVYSDFTAAEFPGPWEAGGNVRTEVTEGALSEFFYEIRRIRDEKISQAELDETKRAVVARFALALERPSRVIGYAVARKIYNFPDDYWDAYPAKIAAVTADDVQRVARRYLDPQALQIVAVGDGDKIKPALEKYGPVEVYDRGGKRVSGSAR